MSKVASTPDEVETYAQCTLLAASLAASHDVSSTKLNAVKACVEYLQENEFIARRTVTDSGLANSFYRAMHFSAKRGIEIAYRPSVRLSVTIRYRDHIGWNLSLIHI